MDRERASGLANLWIEAQSDVPTRKDSVAVQTVLEGLDGQAGAASPEGILVLAGKGLSFVTLSRPAPEGGSQSAQVTVESRPIEAITSLTLIQECFVQGEAEWFHLRRWQVAGDGWRLEFEGRLYPVNRTRDAPYLFGGEEVAAGLAEQLGWGYPNG